MARTRKKKANSASSRRKRKTARKIKEAREAALRDKQTSSPVVSISTTVGCDHSGSESETESIYDDGKSNTSASVQESISAAVKVDSTQLELESTFSDVQDYKARGRPDLVAKTTLEIFERGVNKVSNRMQRQLKTLLRYIRNNCDFTRADIQIAAMACHFLREGLTSQLLYEEFNTELFELDETKALELLQPEYHRYYHLFCAINLLDNNGSPFDAFQHLMAMDELLADHPNRESILARVFKELSTHYPMYVEYHKAMQAADADNANQAAIYLVSALLLCTEQEPHPELLLQVLDAINNQHISDNKPGDFARYTANDKLSQPQHALLSSIGMFRAKQVKFIDTHEVATAFLLKVFDLAWGDNISQELRQDIFKIIAKPLLLIAEDVDIERRLLIATLTTNMHNPKALDFAHRAYWRELEQLKATNEEDEETIEPKHYLISYYFALDSQRKGELSAAGVSMREASENLSASGTQTMIGDFNPDTHELIKTPIFTWQEPEILVEEPKPENNLSAPVQALSRSRIK